jgi:hypothetical protein
MVSGNDPSSFYGVSRAALDGFHKHDLNEVLKGIRKL